VSESLFLLVLFVGLATRIVQACSGGKQARKPGGRTLLRGRRLAQVVPVDARALDHAAGEDPVLRLDERESE
jgi:hypothetical protein